MRQSAKTETGQNFQYEMHTRPKPGQGLVIGPDYVDGCYYCRVLVRFFGALNSSRAQRAQMMRAVGWLQTSPQSWLCPTCKDDPMARQSAPRNRSGRASFAQGFGFMDASGNLMGFPMAAEAFQQQQMPPQMMPAPGPMPQQLPAAQPAAPAALPPPQAQAQPQNGNGQHAPAPQQMQQPQPRAVAMPMVPQFAAPPRQPQPVGYPQQTAPVEAQPAPPPQAFQHRPISMGRRARSDWRTHSGSPAASQPLPQPPHIEVVPTPPEPDYGRARAVAGGEPGAPQIAGGAAAPLPPPSDPSQT
jgi:hypothetical protein